MGLVASCRHAPTAMAGHVLRFSVNITDGVSHDTRSRATKAGIPEVLRSAVSKTVPHHRHRKGSGASETACVLVLASGICAMKLADLFGFSSDNVFPAVEDAEHCLCQRGFAGCSNPVLEFLSTRTHVPVILTIGWSRVRCPDGLAADVIALAGSRFDAVNVEAHAWIMPLVDERVIYHARFKQGRARFISCEQTGHTRIRQCLFDEQISSINWG